MSLLGQSEAEPVWPDTQLVITRRVGSNHPRSICLAAALPCSNQSGIVLHPSLVHRRTTAPARTPCCASTPLPPLPTPTPTPTPTRRLRNGLLYGTALCRRVAPFPYLMHCGLQAGGPARPQPFCSDAQRKTAGTCERNIGACFLNVYGAVLPCPAELKSTAARSMDRGGGGDTSAVTTAATKVVEIEKRMVHKGIQHDHLSHACSPAAFVSVHT